MTETAIFVHQGTRQALTHALALAVTSLAAGDDVLLALFHDALGGWHASWRGEEPGYGEAPWAQALARGFSRRAVPPVAEQVQRCREVGGERFRVVACGAAVELLGLDLDALLDDGIVDDVVGLPTIWRRASGRRIVSV